MMNSFYKVALPFFFLVFFCSGCATIFNGTKQKITIDSKPQGALVKVQGKVIGNTPLTVKESPKKPLDIVFAYPGYEERVFVLQNKFEWQWFLLDAPLTYAAVCIPFGVDLITQAPYRFVQKEVMMNFDSVYVAPPARIDTQQVQLHVPREKIERTREDILAIEQEKRQMKIAARQEERRLQRVQDSTEHANHIAKRVLLRAYNLSLLDEYKNVIAWQPPALLLSEISLSYHRTVYKGISLGVELGYKFRKESNGQFKNDDQLNINDVTTQMMFMPFAESKYIGLAAKFPLPISRGIFYISPVGFFRNTNYDHATVTWENQVDRRIIKRYYDSVSVNRNSYGAKLLFGLRPIVKISEHTAFEFDIYAGLGLRQQDTKIYHYLKTSKITTTSNSLLVVEKQNVEENEFTFVPSLHLGFRIGLRF